MTFKSDQITGDRSLLLLSDKLSWGIYYTNPTITFSDRIDAYFSTSTIFTSNIIQSQFLLALLSKYLLFYNFHLLLWIDQTYLNLSKYNWMSIIMYYGPKLWVVFLKDVVFGDILLVISLNPSSQLMNSKNFCWLIRWMCQQKLSNNYVVPQYYYFIYLSLIWKIWKISCISLHCYWYITPTHFSKFIICNSNLDNLPLIFTLKYDFCGISYLFQNQNRQTLKIQ